MFPPFLDQRPASSFCDPASMGCCSRHLPVSLSTAPPVMLMGTPTESLLAHRAYFSGKAASSSERSPTTGTRCESTGEPPTRRALRQMSKNCKSAETYELSLGCRTHIARSNASRSCCCESLRRAVPRKIGGGVQFLSHLRQA